MSLQAVFIFNRKKQTGHFIPLRIVQLLQSTNVKTLMKKENGGISQAGQRENHRFFGLQVGKSGWKKRRHQKLSAAGAVAKVKVSFYTRKSKG